MRRPTSAPRRSALSLSTPKGLFLSLSAAALVTLPTTGFAQARNGPLTVLGFRAPDGEDEIAASATAAVRRAARAAQFDVPDTAPTLEQAMALAGCDETPEPNCLGQMAQELNTQRLLYGSVRRAGGGRGGPLRVEVYLFERSSRALSGPAVASDVARAIALDDRALDGSARRLVDEVLAAAAARARPATPPPTGEQNGGSASGGTHPGGSNTALPPDEGPTHGTVTPGVPIRRYIGFGAIGLGAVFMIIGAVEGFVWLNFASEAQQPGTAWVQYQPFAPDDPRTRDTGQICDAARRGLPNTYGTASAEILLPDVRRTCDTHGSLQGAQWGFLAAGAVIAAAGVVLAVTDRTGREARPAGAQNARRDEGAGLRFAVAPVLTPWVQGATLAVQF